MALTRSNRLGDDIYKKEVFYIDTKSLTYSLKKILSMSRVSEEEEEEMFGSEIGSNKFESFLELLQYFFDIRNRVNESPQLPLPVGLQRFQDVRREYLILPFEFYVLDSAFCQEYSLNLLPVEAHFG